MNYWSDAEVLKLQAALQDGSLTHAAHELGRTRDAVYQKAVKLGLIQPERRPSKPRVSRFTRVFCD